MIWLGRALRVAILLVLAPAALAGLAASSPARAQMPPPGYEQFKHVRWAVDEGAPNFASIVQTPDGYLWLSGQQLERFDGVGYETIDWPAKSGRRRLAPFGLMVSSKGDLWIGLRDGAGVAVYRDGALHDMHLPDPAPAIGYLVEMPDGSIWTGSGTPTKRLNRYRAGRWERIDEALQLPEGAIMSMSVTSQGGLWIALTQFNGAGGLLAYLPPHGTRFVRMPVVLGARGTATLDPQGALWVADANGVRKLYDAEGRPVTSVVHSSPIPNLRYARMAFDARGGIWVTTASVGLLRIASADGASRAMSPFRDVDGLTSDVATTAFIDREGSVWIGTENGLDQFRLSRAVQEPSIPADPGGGLEMARANDGSMYFQVHTQVLHKPLAGPARPVMNVRLSSVAICAARGGGIWVVDGVSAFRIVGDRVVSSRPFPLKDGAYSCAEDREGRLWAPGHGLSWLEDAGWHRPEGIGQEEEITEAKPTPDGDIALVAGKKIGFIRGANVTFTDLTSTGVGSLRMITADGDGMLVGGSGGVLRIRHGRMALISERRFPWLNSVRAVVRTPHGKTWLMTQHEISRVASADFDRAFDDPQAPLPRTIFSAQDGLLSVSQHPGFWGQQAALGGDGRIWFLNRYGAAYFDPPALRLNTVVPPVVIRSLAAAGRTYDLHGTLRLPAGTRSFEIAYAALSFMVPQRVQFRYRLEGVDEDWVDPGTRRSAPYSNIGPGHYRFQVIAANNDGLWNKVGAIAEFDIPPTFLESRLFKGLCAAALLALLWLLYSLRLRAVSARIRSHMAERMAERERIARELHDTLLQSVQSLTLRFQMAVDDLSKRNPARRGLEAAIDLADQVIAEGRDRVRDLRSIQDSDIEQIVCDLVARQDFDPSVEIAIRSTGAARKLEPMVVDEVTRIAGEAIFNIRKHAKARRVSIEIDWGPAFRIRFADDGVGIDADVAQAGGREGHFGLPGMRERARRLRGDLAVRSLAGWGTELVLTVPGRLAYKGERRSRLARFWSLA